MKVAAMRVGVDVTHKIREDFFLLWLFFYWIHKVWQALKTSFVINLSKYHKEYIEFNFDTILCNPKTKIHQEKYH